MRNFILLINVEFTYVLLIPLDDDMLVAQSCLTSAVQWTVTDQAPLSMGFSRREYWSGLPFPTPELDVDR